MSELKEALVGESYAARPAHITEGVSEELAHLRVPGAPHTLYEELWHIAFWQQMSLDWIAGRETAYPERPQMAFPTEEQTDAESWEALRRRFLRTSDEAARAAEQTARLDEPVRCPSRPEHPVRVMSVRDQLISLASHNAYHLGRMVVLRQMLGEWPPASGGFTW